MPNKEIVTITARRTGEIFYLLSPIFPSFDIVCAHNIVRGCRMIAISVLGRCLTRWMIVVLCAASWAMAQEPEGAVIYKQQCALCHENPAKTRAQPLAALRLMSPENIVRSLESGRMKDQGTLLTAEQKRAVAEFLTGRPFGHDKGTAAGPTA